MVYFCVFDKLKLHKMSNCEQDTIFQAQDVILRHF